MSDVILRRDADCLRACCSLLLDRYGHPIPAERGRRMDLVARMERAAAPHDNLNRERIDDAMLREICADDNIAETVRYYRERADNLLAETEGA